MPAVIPFIPLIAAGIGGGAAVYGAHKGAKTQERATDQALGYQREQDRESRRQFDLQEAARKEDVARQVAMMKYEYQRQDARDAPGRNARNAVLARYGIQGGAAPPPPPDFEAMVASGMTPGSIAPGAPAPGTGMPRRGGGGAGLALGALGAMSPALMAYLSSRGSSGPSPTYGTASPGSMGSGPGVGYAMSPLTGGGIGGGVPMSAFPSFDALARYGGYGVPGQDYQGE